jgi:hypothetical protein
MPSAARLPSSSSIMRSNARELMRRAHAERELADLQQAPVPMDAGNVVTLLPRVLTAFRALVAEINRACVAWALLSAAGGPQQMVMVAGARFGVFRQRVWLVACTTKSRRVAPPARVTTAKRRPSA